MLGCIQPMSSPMMNKMLGFCCCAAAGALAAVIATNDASSPRKSFLVEHMACFLSSGCPNWAGSRRPVTHLAEHSARWHEGILEPPFNRPRTAGQQRGDRDG